MSSTKYTITIASDGPTQLTFGNLVVYRNKSYSVVYLSQSMIDAYTKGWLIITPAPKLSITYKSQPLVNNTQGVLSDSIGTIATLQDANDAVAVLTNRFNDLLVDAITAFELIPDITGQLLNIENRLNQLQSTR